MSQASKVIKEIATGPEYTALVQAVGKSDYEAIAKSYHQLTELLEEKKKQILEKIDSLSRQNKGEDRQQFLNAFSLRISTMLTQWHRLNSLMKEQKVTEGEVIGLGNKGDPMVRTTEGRVTIVSGTTAEKGTRIKFRVTGQGEKVDFGQVIDLNPDYFYFLLNQKTLVGVRDLFNSVEGRLKLSPGEMTPEVLNELLKELENIRQLAEGLKAEEKERTNARILTYRKRILGEYGVKMALEFIARQETTEITALYPADEPKVTHALSAPGLFQYPAHQALKSELFNGNELKGYAEMLSNLENKLDSMDTALKLMEFKSGIEEVEPAVREYLAKIDTLFERLHRKARTVIYAIAADKVNSVADVQRNIENAFSGAAVCAELRVFRSPSEFFSLREGLAKLRARLGNTASVSAESATKPYLSQKITLAFERRAVR